MTKDESKKIKKEMDERISKLTTSKLEKLKKSHMIILISIIGTFILWFISLFIVDLWGMIFLAIVFVLSVVDMILQIKIDKENEELTKGSYLYIKKNELYFFINPLYFILNGLFSFIYMIYPDFDKQIINSINLAVCSIVFSLYVFILPIAHKFLKELEVKNKNHRKNKDYFTIQREIYEDKLYMNSLFGVIVSMIFVFVLSEVLYFLQIKLFGLFAYNCFATNIISLIWLMKIINKIFSFDEMKLEIEMFNDCVDKGLLEGKRINTK